MKRTVAIFAVAVMLFSVCGCKKLGKKKAAVYTPPVQMQKV